MDRTTATVATLWTELLSADGVAPESEFFDLGGSSVTAVRLLDSVQDRLGVKVSLRQFLLNPTVAGLSEAISAAQRTSEA
jgi:acyl carrier protein